MESRLLLSNPALSSNEYLRIREISRNAVPFVRTSADREAEINIDIGVNARRKKSHFETGVSLIAKYTKKIQTAILDNLPRYIKKSGDELNSFPDKMPSVCGM